MELKGFDTPSFSNIGFAGQQTSQPKVSQPKKIGGIAGVLVNNLPAIGSGLGAVAGIPLDFLGGAGSIAGGAAGGGLGETIKRKLLGESLDPKQIAIQAAEGGVSSAINPLKLLKGASGAAKSFVKVGANTAAEDLTNGTEKKTGSFLKNLTTQGQQAQGRVAGVSAGSKAGGKELTPQDTTRMLQTFKDEGINTGNANNTLRDVTDKMQSYGKQIGDHFKTNEAPLKPEDTKSIADNFVNGLGTSDPSVLKQADILATDLQKNVKSTKDLWDFRKSLDAKIPDSKFMDEATSAKVTALKSMRQYISDELGQVPGMKNYHDLAEVKPFVSAEAKRLNNPGGGIIGRVLSSGPAQKAENLVGKTTEKVGQMGSSGSIDNGVVSSVKAAGNQVVDHGDTVDIIAKDGSTTTMTKDAFNNLGKDASHSSPISESNLQSASEATQSIPNLVTEKPSKSILNKVLNTAKGVATLPIRAAAAPLAFPGKSIAQVGKQELFRGFGLPASTAQQQDQPQSQPAGTPDASQGQATQPDTTETANPFDPTNIDTNIQSILAQGGTMKDVSDYLSNVDAYQKLVAPSTSATGKPTAQQNGLAQSASQSLQQLAQMIAQDPSIIEKNATPGQGTPLVGSLISNAAGASQYHALADNILSALIHLQTGATATKEEITAAHGQLPQPGDSDATRQQKLQTLMSNFEPFLGTQ